MFVGTYCSWAISKACWFNFEVFLNSLHLQWMAGIDLACSVGGWTIDHQGQHMEESLMKL